VDYVVCSTKKFDRKHSGDNGSFKISREFRHVHSVLGPCTGSYDTSMPCPHPRLLRSLPLTPLRRCCCHLSCSTPPHEVSRRRETPWWTAPPLGASRSPGRWRTEWCSWSALPPARCAARCSFSTAASPPPALLAGLEKSRNWTPHDFCHPSSGPCYLVVAVFVDFFSFDCC